MKLQSVFSTISCLGLNHKSASLDLREKAAFSNECLSDIKGSLFSSAKIEEAIFLSTCNRTEIYFCSEDQRSVVDWMLRHCGVEKNVLLPHLYLLTGIDVIKHASRVACGIDSMVLGETQIVGQMKDAYRAAKELNSTGRLLSKAFEVSFSVSKEVRSCTEIGLHSISLAAAALKITKSVLDNLEDSTILFVGAGEMVSGCADYFSMQPFREICFANRTRSRAEKLQEKYGGKSSDLPSALGNLSGFDVIISCTGSSLPLIGKGVVERALKQRKHRPIIMFDLAVPRDIEGEVGQLDDVFLYSIDDLGEITRENALNRRMAVDAAESFIQKGVDSYSSWLEARESVPILKKFRKFGEDLVEAELDKVLKSEDFKNDPRSAVVAMSRTLGNKFLDRPSRALNNYTGEDRKLLMDALTRLFDLGNK